MDLPHRFRRWFKTRFAVLYPFGLYLILFSNSDDHSIMHGIWFIMAGLLIRLWANGYAIKMDRLTTCGPYAYLRHPLYLGTILLMLGFILMQKVYVVGAVFLAAFLFVYSRTIRSEEGMLLAKFGQGYTNYRMSVPAIFPTFQAYRNGEKWPFSFQRLLHSQEYKLFLWMIILIIGFHLKDELLIEHETPDLKIWMLTLTALAMASSDFILDIFRKRKYNSLIEKLTGFLTSTRRNILCIVVLSFVF
ncbi:MAG: isoprenylcysteine carboxylmethyltransferase family protein, partial [Candidatus Omnitrophica bacterium]|nr:isoprenylcysteine carboxylmethyltransferase family protein [Candidatus Omnitrophota bacterium]